MAMAARPDSPVSRIILTNSVAVPKYGTAFMPNQEIPAADSVKEQAIDRSPSAGGTATNGATPLPDSEDSEDTEATRNPGELFLSVLRLPNFRTLWIGQVVSMLGDQVHLVALPWLALKLTGDPFTLGTVLALAGIPHALFMLVGGAFTDRFSPRKVMLVSTSLRMGVVALLAGVVLMGRIELWMLYIFALAFGTMDAFFYPASIAIIPDLVDDSQLRPANALIQGSAQLSQLAGPVTGGLIIALLAGQRIPLGGHTIPDLAGIGVAFGFDSFTFLVAAVTLWAVRTSHQPHPGADRVLSSMWEGFLVVWNDITLRTLFAMVAGITFLVVGPTLVGVPVFADTRYGDGAVSYGIVLSAYGGGSFVGTLMGAILRKPKPARLGAVLLATTGLLGVGIVGLGLIWHTWPAAAAALLMGLANGYVSILFITWLQSRTPQHMLGRIMSLLMFASVGLLPLSMAAAGALIKIHATGLLVVAGSLLVVMVIAAAFNPAMRQMGRRSGPGQADQSYNW